MITYKIKKGYFDEIYGSSKHKYIILENVAKGKVEKFWNTNSKKYEYIVNGEGLETAFFEGKLHKDSNTIWLNLISTVG